MGTKDNQWSRSHDLQHDFTFLYSGTLGRKHNPMLLAKLAQDCGSVIVVAQGYGVPYLQTVKAEQRLDTLTLLPIQPAKHLADVLATADVLVATIEPDASTFAVIESAFLSVCRSADLVGALKSTQRPALWRGPMLGSSSTQRTRPVFLPPPRDYEMIRNCALSLVVMDGRAPS